MPTLNVYSFFCLEGNEALCLQREKASPTVLSDKRLILLAAQNSIFAMAVALLTRARRHEIFASTAA